MRDERSAIISFSTKAEGSMKLTDGTNDFKNIEKFLLSKKLSSKFIRMGQIHSNNVVVVTDTSKRLIKDTDALITDRKELSLTVITADCLPILFFDPQKHVIATVHAGSKGLAVNIIHNTVRTIMETFGTDPSNLQVTIGPGIEKRCYEVGQEVIDTFTRQFGWFDESFYTPTTPDHYLLDLRKIALQCLLKEGILKEHITVSDACTRCSDEYYSYRRGDKTGRFVSAICMTEEV